MSLFTKIALAGALAVGGLAATGASAAPMMDPGLGAAQTESAQIEKARVVCDMWGRCWRTAPRVYRPRGYGYGFYGPRPFYGHRHYGHRHWRRW